MTCIGRRAYTWYVHVVTVVMSDRTILGTELLGSHVLFPLRTLLKSAQSIP
jgi:hypothetical protein